VLSAFWTAITNCCRHTQQPQGSLSCCSFTALLGHHVDRWAGWGEEVSLGWHLCSLPSTPPKFLQKGALRYRLKSFAIFFHAGETYSPWLMQYSESSW
jgi:hypothetical protein